MKGEKHFFWVRSGEHDHWTNGTAQHSWRVYQYMRYMWEHPEEIPCNRKALRDPSFKAESELATDKVKALTENEIILTSLLHDVGKTEESREHERKSKEIIDRYLGNGFTERNPKIVAAIFFHHHVDKNGGFLNKYRNTALKKLLNIADSMASGTTWHSTRFKENRSQRHGKKTSDIKHLRRVAMDRSRQVLDYRMFLDCTYNLQTIIGYSSKSIVWNSYSEAVNKIKNGTIECISLPDKVDYITAAHHLLQKNNGACIVVGIDLSIIKYSERNLRQENPHEEEFLICSNVVMAFYRPKYIEKFRYSYTMRDETMQLYQNQSSDKGIFLPQVTFFRDGVSEGFRMVTPWTCDVLLVPGWKGVMLLEQL